MKGSVIAPLTKLPKSAENGSRLSLFSCDIHLPKGPALINITEGEGHDRA